MITNMYPPMNRIVNELNRRINTMPNYLGEAAQFAGSYIPKVNVEFKNIVLAPRVDAVEDSNTYTILVELPGVGKEDVHVVVKDRVMTISGEKKRENIGQNVRFITKGRRFGKFERSFTLPENASSEGIAAECAGGILTLTIPKIAEKQPETVTVEIK